MDLQLINTFLEVAQCGSFAAASERLYVTQSAVSLRVQRLEDQLGQPLFSRNSDGVSLTRAGEQFRPHAEALLHHWQEARLAVSAPPTAQSLKISLPAPLGFGLLPAWLLTLLEEAPELALAINANGEDVRLAFHGRAEAGYHPEPIGVMELGLFAKDSGARRLLQINWGEELSDWQLGGGDATGEPAISLAAVEPALELMRQGGFCAYLPILLAPHEFQEVMPENKFPLRIWAHWRSGLGEELRNVARRTLLRALKQQEIP